jgi:hypothetical protein
VPCRYFIISFAMGLCVWRLKAKLTVLSGSL